MFHCSDMAVLVSTATIMTVPVSVRVPVPIPEYLNKKVDIVYDHDLQVRLMTLT